MDLQKKVLDYKEEVIKGIQGAVQIKVFKNLQRWETFW